MPSRTVIASISNWSFTILRAVHYFAAAAHEIKEKAAPKERLTWRRGGSNPRPDGYEPYALPAELRRHVTSFIAKRSTFVNYKNHTVR